MIRALSYSSTGNCFGLYDPICTGKPYAPGRLTGHKNEPNTAHDIGAVVQNNDTMQTFLRRARAFMDCVPPWTPLILWRRDLELSKDRYEPRAKTLKCIKRALGRLAPNAVLGSFLGSLDHLSSKDEDGVAFAGCSISRPQLLHALLLPLLLLASTRAASEVCRRLRYTC